MMASANWQNLVEELTILTESIKSIEKSSSVDGSSHHLLLEDEDSTDAGKSTAAAGRREGQVPSVCKEYNSDGCRKVDCRKLHVCYYWVKDKCLNDNCCSKKHTIDDVLNQCVFSALGWSHDQRHKVFQDMKFAYKSGRHPSHVAVKVCLDYSTSSCRSNRCKRFHVCHGFLFGTCSDSGVCHLRHDALSGTHNHKLAQELEICSGKELHNILKQSLSSVEVSPSICDEYNTRRGCHKNYCNQLHCCKFFALYGSCRFKSDCYKTHTLGSFHNRKVLDRFGLSSHQALTVIRNRCSKNNLSRWDSQDEASSSSVETLKRRNEQLEREVQLLRIENVVRW